VSDTQAVLGIDLGTSQLKALVTTLDGQILGRGRASYPVVVPAEGRAETDPGDWSRAARTAVREALAETASGVSRNGGPRAGASRIGGTPTGRAAATGVDVVGLAVAGQIHGVVLADAAGAPARPAVTGSTGTAPGH
jgi:xylulokinase